MTQNVTTRAGCWPDGTPMQRGQVNDDGEYEWKETVDAAGLLWFERRPRFFKSRLRIRVRDKRDGEARLRQVDDLREKVRLRLITQKQALVALGVLVRGRVLSVADVWEKYMNGCSDRTRRIGATMWKHHLAPYFASRAAAELNANVMREWEQVERAKPGRRAGETLAPKTVRNAFDLLSAAMGRAVEAQELDEMPWEGYKAPRIPGVMERLDSRGVCTSVDELMALVRVALEHDERSRASGRYSDVAHKIYIVAMLGLRQGEACGLGWDNVNIDREPFDCTLRYQVHDGWRARHPDWERPKDVLKSRRPTFALHPGAVNALRLQRELVKARGWYAPDGPVFPVVSGNQNVGGWRSHAQVIAPDYFRALVEAAGLPSPERWVVHSLRHSFVTLESASQPTLRDLQARSGHASLQALGVYMHRAGRGMPQSGIAASAGDCFPTLLHAPDEGARLIAQLGERSDGLPVATTERGRIVEAERTDVKRKEREGNRRAYMARQSRAKEAGAYSEVLARATNDEIRALLTGPLGSLLNDMRRAAYIRAYLKKKRDEGAEAARLAGTRAAAMWSTNFYNALRNNARARGLLPEGWSPPVRGVHGTAVVRVSESEASDEQE